MYIFILTDIQKDGEDPGAASFAAFTICWTPQFLDSSDGNRVSVMQSFATKEYVAEYPAGRRLLRL